MRKILLTLSFLILIQIKVLPNNYANLSQYLYEDTKKVVVLVEDAANLVEKKGEKAFQEFKVRNSKWFKDNYIFIYDPNGVCVFHAMTPELVGKNLISLIDIDNKPVIKMIADVALKPQKQAREWLFYLWEENTQFAPKWKSAYIRKAITPTGKVYLVGSGLYNLKVEKVFIQKSVDDACQKLLTKGLDAAFELFKNPDSQFNLLDTYIFVMNQEGTLLFDPAFPTLKSRNLISLKDVVGKLIVEEILLKTKNQNKVWLQYLWPKPGSSLPIRKIVYARKIIIDGQALIVGSDFYIDSPIWMR